MKLDRRSFFKALAAAGVAAAVPFSTEGAKASPTHEPVKSGSKLRCAATKIRIRDAHNPAIEMYGDLASVSANRSYALVETTNLLLPGSTQREYTPGLYRQAVEVTIYNLRGELGALYANWSEVEVLMNFAETELGFMAHILEVVSEYDGLTKHTLSLEVIDFPWMT